MCKAVADKAETALAYLAARLWFVGSRISLVARHGGSKATPTYKEPISSCGVDNSLLPRSAAIFSVNLTR